MRLHHVVGHAESNRHALITNRQVARQLSGMRRPAVLTEVPALIRQPDAGHHVHLVELVELRRFAQFVDDAQVAGDVALNDVVEVHQVNAVDALLPGDGDGGAHGFRGRRTVQSRPDAFGWTCIHPARRVPGRRHELVERHLNRRVVHHRRANAVDQVVAHPALHVELPVVTRLEGAGHARKESDRPAALFAESGEQIAHLRDVLAEPALAAFEFVFGETVSAFTVKVQVKTVQVVPRAHFLNESEFMLAHRRL